MCVGLHETDTHKPGGHRRRNAAIPERLIKELDNERVFLFEALTHPRVRSRFVTSTSGRLMTIVAGASPSWQEDVLKMGECAETLADNGSKPCQRKIAIARRSPRG